MPISTYKLIEHFSKKPSCRVHAIFPERGEFSARVENLGVQVEIVPFARLRSPRHLTSFVKFLVRFLPAFWRITSHLKAQGIELVHFSDFIDAPFYPASVLAGTKAVAHLRYNLANGLSRSMYRAWVYLFVGRVICISKSVATNSGLQTGKTTTIYNPGPDPRLFDPSVAHKKNSRPGTIVAIAKFLPIKGHTHLIEVFRLVRQFPVEQARLVIVGDRQAGHEEYHRNVLRRIRQYGLAEHVEITGQLPHEKIASILASADVFVHLAACQEGLGGVLLEAMAMGVPVVAFDSGGVRECFTHGKSGFLVPQFEYEGAASKIVEILNNPSLGRRLGKEASREVRRRFSYSTHFQQVEALYRIVLGMDT